MTNVVQSAPKGSADNTVTKAWKTNLGTTIKAVLAVLAMCGFASAVIKSEVELAKTAPITEPYPR